MKYNCFNNSAINMSALSSQSLVARTKVQALMKRFDTSKTKLGAVLGCISKNSQARIDRTNRFLESKKSISLDDLQKIANFYDLPLTYFLKNPDTSATSTTALRAREGSLIEVGSAEIDRATEHDLDRLLSKMHQENPWILNGVPFKLISEELKRVILKAYYTAPITNKSSSRRKRKS